MDTEVSSHPFEVTMKTGKILKGKTEFLVISLY